MACGSTPRSRTPASSRPCSPRRPDSDLAAYEVGRGVNNPRNNGPELTAPIEPLPPVQAVLL